MQPIFPLRLDKSQEIQKIIDNKTKPLGALGQLETLALQLALINEQRCKLTLAHIDKSQPQKNKISVSYPVMMVFAGDHGINEAGLSIAPSSVTKQMVLNFLHGGAAINCFCQSNDITLKVIDCGILEAVTPKEYQASVAEKNNVTLITQRLGQGTDNFSQQPAMNKQQLKLGFELGKKLVESQVEAGAELLLFGEMGIGNTSAAAALMAALTNNSVSSCVGRGTGISDEQLARKISLIEQAVQRIILPENSRVSLDNDQILTILTELGGFEIVQMVSAMLTAATNSIPIVVDGFIVSIAALIAYRLDKNIINYFIFSHVSKEQAHQLLLSELLAAQTFTEEDSKPLLDLGLRLGEGTGAALALPIIQASVSFYNNMASFESAGVTV